MPCIRYIPLLLRASGESRKECWNILPLSDRKRRLYRRKSDIAEGIHQAKTLKFFLEVLDSGSLFGCCPPKLKRVPSADQAMTMSHWRQSLDSALCLDRSPEKRTPYGRALALELKRFGRFQRQLRELQTRLCNFTQGLEKRTQQLPRPRQNCYPPGGMRPLARLSEDFLTLEVEDSARSRSPMRSSCFHGGRVQLALVFERPALDERERFFRNFVANSWSAVVGPWVIPGPMRGWPFARSNI